MVYSDFLHFSDQNIYFKDWAIWISLDGCDIAAELSFEAHPIDNWREGTSNFLAVSFITARMSLDTHPSEIECFEQGRTKTSIFWSGVICSRTRLSGQVQIVVNVRLS